MATETHTEVIEINRGWRITQSAPGAATEPSHLPRSATIEDAVVPGTVASTLVRRQDNTNLPDANFDDFDWWYECDIEIDPDAGCYFLQLDGLATIAEVWMNNEKILDSRNMFRSYRVDVTSFIQPQNHIAMVFRSITQELKAKRPRPRWKTNLVSNQQLRWIRTTLLGRIPGWTPAIQPVGPWRSVLIEKSRSFLIEGAEVNASLENGDCIVDSAIRLRLLDSNLVIEGATISLLGLTYPLATSADGVEIEIKGRVEIPDAPLWWPHTLGAPNLHAFEVKLQSNSGEFVVRRGQLGFRSIAVDRSNGGVRLSINGTNVFARGACWSSNDIISLDGQSDGLRSTLELFRDSGANMIRVGGTMVYESDAFYDICDELGLLVWQDFMFASMDYPADDEDFFADVSAEIEYQLLRLREHPSLAVMCGNSEVEQQSAMWGRPREFWRNRLFYDLIPETIDRHRVAIPYFPSSPCEGALPFHNDEGISHYFGVGAYKRPIDEARSANVKFAAECLGFSNVPDSEALVQHFGSSAPTVHHPLWKAGVPRDSSAGWDFEDIRDHYLESLYGVNPTQLRYSDKLRYIELSKVVTGEVMERVYGFWRQSENPCNGALIWFLKDLVPGAGWGIFDSLGRPKPLYYFLKRSWAAVSIALTDRGLDGLHACVINDTADERKLTIVVELFRDSRTTIARESKTVVVASNSDHVVSVDQMLGLFYDVAYAYRFGPPKHDVVMTSVFGESNDLLASSCYFPNGHNLKVFDDAVIELDTRTTEVGTSVTITSDRFLKDVFMTAPGHRFSDNYFNLAPDTEKSIFATPLGDADPVFKLRLQASNLAVAQTLQ